MCKRRHHPMFAVSARRSSTQHACRQLPCTRHPRPRTASSLTQALKAALVWLGTNGRQQLAPLLSAETGLSLEAMQVSE